MIKTIGVIGAGQMGHGIAQVCAIADYNVLVVETSETQRAKAQLSIQKSLEKLFAKGSLSKTPQEILSQLMFFDTFDTLKDVDLVIEAIPEQKQLKENLFKDLDKLLPPDVFFASNTSSISITALASVTKRPDKVIGVHFMNPVPLMHLVEVICGLQTSEETYKTVKEVLESLGKTIITSKDRPGFIVNRVLMPMINEAIFTLQEHLGSKEDIDTAMRLGTNQPMGPLALADLIGLDTCLSILRVLHHGLGEDKYRPCPLLVSYVEAGWLGRKTGKGFYEYE